MITKPAAETLTGYIAGYVSQAPGTGLLEALNDTLKQTIELHTAASSKVLYRYAEGKWTIEEALAHVIDTERIFAYRALTFARADKTELPPFDQDAYVPYSNANSRTMQDLLKEFEIVRQGSIHLFRSFAAEALDMQGTANKLTVTPRIIGWMIAGHNAHHNRILQERYL